MITIRFASVVDSEGCGICLSLLGPEREIVSEQLHDECGILIKVIVHIVQVCDGLVEGVTSHFASLRGVLLNLVVENAEIEGQSKSDRMRGRKTILCQLVSSFIGVEGLLSGETFLLS
jgi:hypothetical protein